jgi:hypothetical protein
MYKVNTDILKLSTAQVLSSVNQIAVLEYFIGNTVKLNMNITSPIRSDLNPGCRYTIKEGDLILFDCSKGTSYNIIRIISEKLGRDYYKAKELIIENFIYKKINTLSKKEQKNIIIEPEKQFNILCKIREPNIKELEFWSIGGLEITSEILKQYGIYTTSFYKVNNTEIKCDVAYIFKHKNFTQIYRPDLPKNGHGLLGRYRANNMNGVHSFDNKIHSDYSITNKSFIDGFYSSLLEFNTKFCLKEGMIFKEENYKEYSPTANNLILWDNDETGIRESQKHNFFKPIYYPNVEGVKDTRDYLRNYGKEQTKQYLNEQICKN